MNPARIADDLLAALKHWDGTELDEDQEDLVRDAIWKAWREGQRVLREIDAEGDSHEP